MKFKPRQYIQSRTREEWQMLVLERYADVRSWIQKNGEKAAVCALVFGIALVLFYKLVFVVIAIAVILGCVTWNVALPAASSSRGDEAPIVHREESANPTDINRA